MWRVTVESRWFAPAAIVCVLAVLLASLSALYLRTGAVAAPGASLAIEAPGGPVLVVYTSTNPYGLYLTEILRAEGLNAFSTADIGALTAAELDRHDVAILGEMRLDAAQATLLGDWVERGGTLIAMRPGAELANLMGLGLTGATVANGYLRVDTAAAPGKGIVGETMQFHGEAESYALDGASALATLYADAETPTGYPAVTMREVGTGHAVAFAYDLARSVVYTRQGNPAWAGRARDGEEGPIRPDNLFFDDTATGPGWLDFARIQIPQADEQQRLLANIVTTRETRLPLPRFWYFARNAKAVVVMTQDEHGLGNLVGRLERYDELSPAGCDVDAWGCVRSTSYIFTKAKITMAEMQLYQDEGHEFGVHINTHCRDFTPASLADAYAAQIAKLKRRFPGIDAQRTERTHCVAFSDWDSQPKIELRNGIRLDTNYYYYPAKWVDDRPGLFTGSGIPMRFAASDGNLIDVFQVPTQLTNESGQDIPRHIGVLLDNALGPKGYYGAFVANIHTDAGPTADAEAEQIVRAAQARGVSVIAASQLLAWLDARNASSFAEMVWQDDTLTFDIVGGAPGLTAMVPMIFGDGELADLMSDEIAVPYTVETIKGIAYAVFAAQPAGYAARYAGHNR